jgi:hypothetical protein
MVLQTWSDVIVTSLQVTWSAVAGFVPLFLGAVIVFIIGWIIAVSLGKLVEHAVRSVKVDAILQSLDVHKALERAGLRLDSGVFIGGLVKWFLIIASLLAAVNILGLVQVSTFLRDVLLYIPNVIVAVLILLIAVMVAETTERVVRASVDAAGLQGKGVGVVVRWAIWIFAIVAVLLQLGIAADLIRIVIMGFVAALAVAFGLAFGLGGQSHASAFLEKVKRDLSNHGM